MVTAEFKRDLETFGGINSVLGTIVLKGNATFLGNGSYMADLTASNIFVNNVTVNQTVVIQGNLTANNFIGNSCVVTDIIADDILGNNALITTGNIGNIILSDGNIVAENLVASNVSTDDLIAGNVTAENLNSITGVFTIGNVSNELTVGGNLVSNIIICSGSIISTANIGNTLMSGGNIALSGQINALGNVVGNYYYGNGSQLTGIAPAKIPAPNFRAYANNTTIFLNGNRTTLFPFNFKDTTFDNTFYNNTGAIVVIGGRTVPGYSFSPNIAGYYLIGATTRVEEATREHNCIIYKNASPYAQGSDVDLTAGNNLNHNSTVSALMYMNGTTDYTQIYVYLTSSGNSGSDTSGSLAWFNGILLNTGTIVQ